MIKDVTFTGNATGELRRLKSGKPFFAISFKPGISVSGSVSHKDREKVYALMAVGLEKADISVGGGVREVWFEDNPMVLSRRSELSIKGSIYKE